MKKILLENDFSQVTSTTLSQSNGIEKFSVIKIIHSDCEAEISLYGGQVLSFKPTGHKDILWLSHDAIYQSGKAIRGGIPLCWPWFGTYSKKTDEKVAKHGFARQLVWEIDSVEADELGVNVVLSLTGENQHSVWPNAYRLTQTLFFGKDFKQSLAMTNLSQEDAQYSAALHSYFAVSKPNNININTLTGVKYFDQLTGHSTTQENNVSCVGEIDRIYNSSEKMTFVDNEWQRKIEMTSSHCQQWVLWNAGTELANTMEDIHLNGEQEYVCLEAANTTLQTLPAGKTVVISQEIAVCHL